MGIIITPIGDSEPIRAEIITKVQSIREIFEESRILLGNSRDKLYDALDRVYVEASIIDADEVYRKALLDFARSDATFRRGGSYDPDEKRTEALLIALGQGGNDTKSSRSRYLKALIAADVKGNVPREPGKLTAWLRKNDGITKAGNLLDDKPTDRTIEQLAASLPADEQAAEIETEALQVGDSLPAGLFLLLAESVDQGEGKSRFRVRAKLTGESLLRAALEEALSTVTPKTYSDEERRQIENRSLWTLNKLMLKEAGIIISRATHKDKRAFSNAYHALRGFPDLSEKYFDGEPEFSLKEGHDEKKDKKGKFIVKSWSRIAVQNPGFHDLDPGRYIKGAKEGALIPYKIDPDKLTWKQAEARAYAEAHNRPRRDKPEPSKNPSSLAGFMENESELGDPEDVSMGQEDQLR